MKNNQLNFDFGEKPKKAPAPKKRVEPLDEMDAKWEKYDGPRPRPSDEWDISTEELKAKLVRKLHETIDILEDVIRIVGNLCTNDKK